MNEILRDYLCKYLLISHDVTVLHGGHQHVNYFTKLCEIVQRCDFAFTKWSPKRIIGNSKYILHNFYAWEEHAMMGRAGVNHVFYVFCPLSVTVRAIILCNTSICHFHLSTFLVSAILSTWSYQTSFLTSFFLVIDARTCTISRITPSFS
jgi:hypothetical protein